MLGDQAAETWAADLAARRALGQGRDGIASAVDAMVVDEVAPANPTALLKRKIDLDVLARRFEAKM